MAIDRQIMVIVGSAGETPIAPVARIMKREDVRMVRTDPA